MWKLYSGKYFCRNDRCVKNCISFSVFISLYINLKIICRIFLLTVSSFLLPLSAWMRFKLETWKEQWYFFLCFFFIEHRRVKICCHGLSSPELTSIRKWWRYATGLPPQPPQSIHSQKNDALEIILLKIIWFKF